MKYFIKLLKTLLYPAVVLFVEFLVQYIFIFLFNHNEIDIIKQSYPNFSQTQVINKLNKLISTKQYQMRLSNYLSDNILIIVIITSIILIPLFILFYKKYRMKSQRISIWDIIFIILLGMSVSIIFNVIIFELNSVWHFTNNYKISTASIFIQILSSGFIGPVLEELVFRGVVYNKLKEFNSYKRSIVLTSLFFALFHISNPLNVIYAFMMSFFFLYLYEKYKSLRYPILMHVSANSTVILIMYIITKQIVWLNIILILVSLAVFIFIYIKMLRKDVYIHR